jgi:clan AA aspartic protease (TIGR02281 family)
MGLWDRDYWRERHNERDWKDSYYDPKQFRGGRRPRGPSKPPPGQGIGSGPGLHYQPPVSLRTFSIWPFVFWISLIGLVWFGFQHWQPRQLLELIGGRSVPSKLVDDPKKCVLLPASGTRQHFNGTPDVPGRRPATLEVVNNHNLPVVALVSDLGSGQKLQALVVDKGSSAGIQLPSGQYDLILHAGESGRWCNLAKGFSDGAAIQMNGGVVLQGAATTQVVLKNTANKADGFSVSYQSVRPIEAETPKTNTGTGGGALRLRQTADGHYFTGGSINGFPIVFMVDTGATNVAISSNVAARAGIDRCARKVFSTANGSVQGCSATVKEMTFGSFRLLDVEVAVMPNMQGEALLGMNALRWLRLEQSDGVLTLTTR